MGDRGDKTMSKVTVEEEWGGVKSTAVFETYNHLEKVVRAVKALDDPPAVVPPRAAPRSNRSAKKNNVVRLDKKTEGGDGSS
jgi:hypothetical protein